MLTYFIYNSMICVFVSGGNCLQNSNSINKRLVEEKLTTRYI